jgi:hypothetical protein
MVKGRGIRGEIRYEERGTMGKGKWKREVRDGLLLDNGGSVFISA